MAYDGFTKIRNGLLEHVEAQQFTPGDLGVYLYLHMRANWRTGICWTNCQSIATTFGCEKWEINESFQRLRAKGYINYPHGNGRRGNYPVAISNAEPTLGLLKGWRLTGFVGNGFERVEYQISNAGLTDDQRSTYARLTENLRWDLRSTNAGLTLNLPLQDIQDFKTSKTLQDLPDFQDLPHGQGAGAAEPQSDGPNLEAQTAKGIDWDFSPMDDITFRAFVDKVNPKREDGTRGKWQPEGHDIVAMVKKGDAEAHALSAAIRYTLGNCAGLCTFEQFSAVAESARADYRAEEAHA